MPDKTITVETLKDGAEYLVLTPEFLVLYKEEDKHRWQFTVRPVKTGDLVKVDTALNRRAGLFRPDGRTNAEGFTLAKAEELLLLVLTAWNYCDQDGEPLPISAENIQGLPPDVLADAFNQIRAPRIPTPEELAARKNVPAASTTNTGNEAA